jgi:hypothetical protein
MSAHDELDPTEFVARIRQLGEQRDQQDAERVRKLEEDIIQGRSERLARRAGESWQRQSAGPSACVAGLLMGEVNRTREVSLPRKVKHAAVATLYPRHPAKCTRERGRVPYTYTDYGHVLREGVARRLPGASDRFS